MILNVAVQEIQGKRRISEVASERAKCLGWQFASDSGGGNIREGFARESKLV